MAEHIDEGRFAHIASTDKRVLGFIYPRTILHIRTGDNIFGRSNQDTCDLVVYYLVVEELFTGLIFLPRLRGGF